MSARPDQQVSRAQAAGLQPVLLATAFLTVLVLGFVGYRQAEPALDLLTAQYKSVQLFVLEGGVVEGDTPWALELARFLAPLVLAYAAVRAIMLIARDRVTAWRTRLFARAHVLIAGDSPDAAIAADQMLAAGRSVVVITRVLAQFDGHRERGAAVLEGDPRDRHVLARGRPDRATDVVVLMPTDAEGLQVLAACERLLASAGGPSVHVGLNESPLWEELHSVGFTRPHRRVEFFLVIERQARVLLRGLHRRVLVIEGDGPIVDRLVLAAGRASLLDGEPSQIILGPTAQAREHVLLETSPWLSGVLSCDVTGACDGNEPLAAVVAGLDDAASVAFGAWLVRARPDSEVRVAVADDAIAGALDGTGLGARNLKLVPARADALGPALLSDSAIEVLARAKHDDYVARESARGVTQAENASIAPWGELPESLKLSNRRYAEGVAHRLNDAGATLTPLTPGASIHDLDLGEPLLTALAKAEHDRWVRDLLADDWQQTTESKDAEERLHSKLVPWDDLDEADRERARDGIRALPALLARAGYGLELVDAPITAGV